MIPRRRAHSPGVNTPHVKVRTPHEILSVIPYLFGFHPDESVVVLMVSDSLVGMGARLDLSDAAVPGRTADLLLGMLEQADRDDEVILVGYGADRSQVDLVLTTVSDDVRFPVQLAMTVVGDRWFVAWEPGEGEPYDPQSSQIAADATYLGLAAFPNRDELERTFDLPKGVARASQNVLSRAFRSVSAMTSDDAVARMVELLEVHAAVGSEIQQERGSLGLKDLAMLWALLFDGGARDVVWCLVSDATADRLLDLWLEVVRRLPQEDALLPLCVVALAAWQAGRGPLMTMALDKASRLGESHPMLDVLQAIHINAVPPGGLASMLESWAA